MPPLVPVTLAWLLGLVADAWKPLPLWVWLAAGGGIAVVALGCRRRRAARAGPWAMGSLHPWTPSAGLLLVLIALGGARHALARPSLEPGPLAAFNDRAEPVIVTGVVAAYPEVAGSRVRLRVAARSVQLEGGAAQPIRGLLQASLPRYPEWRYGDELRLRGFLERPPGVEGFSYREYLARRGIFSVLDRASGERVRSGLGSPVFAALYALRDRARATIAALLPEPHAALLTGILLGIDGGIPEPVKEAFNATGTTHILVISGYNFAIVAGLMNLAASRVAGRQSTWLAVGGIALYALLVGAEPAVQRAAIMGALYVLGRGLGRETIALNSLAAATLLLTALNPFVLWDLGFQLSVLATLGLILLTPPMSGWVEAILARLVRPRPAWLGLLSEAFVVTLAAQVTTTPLILATFGRVSPVSLVTNVLILPVQSWLMLGGGLATVAGLLWLPLGRLLAAVPWVALSWTLAVVARAARLPAASVEIAAFHGFWLPGYYALLAGVFVWYKGWRPPAGLLDRLRRIRSQMATLPDRTALFLALAALAALLPWLAWHLGADGRLHLYVLNVGQGDALLIVTPAGQQIVVDGGPDARAFLGELAPRLPPWDRRIELLISTHPDADHLGGLPELLARYQVARVLHSGEARGTPLFEEWQRRLSDEGAIVTPARRGQTIAVEDGVRMDVLHPGPASTGEGTNNQAVVLRLRYGQTCALLLGDVEAGTEEALVAGGLSRCALLKVAHHGSATSTSGPLVAAVRPAIALISAGEENRFGHPHPDVIERLARAGARVFRTDRHGTIELVSDGERVWVRTER